MILDTSIKQMKNEVMFLYNITPDGDYEDNFDEIFTGELNDLILLASENLQTFTSALDKPLDKVNYLVLAKIFLFNEISNYLA